MKIYILNGKAGSGKTSFYKFVEEICGVYVMNCSTVDLVKQLASDDGWNGEKTPRNREFLSNLKDLLTEWDDVPYKDVVRRIERFEVYCKNWDIDTKDCAVFIDCREPKEIQKFVDRMGAKTIFVDRKIENYQPSNHADAEVENFKYDIVIDNNKALKHLAAAAINFIETEGIRR